MYRDEPNAMVPIMKVLWKSSQNTQCRQIIENNSVIVNYLNDLLSYQLDVRVIGYAIGTLSELLKSVHMQSHLKDMALSKILDFLQTSHQSEILTHVCNFLNIASCDPECLKSINEIDGFLLITTFIEGNIYDNKNTHDPEILIAAAKCLAEIIKNNTPVHIRI